MSEDDEAERARRAEELRRRIEELAGEQESERPPGSPLEFIEREMREREEEEDDDDGVRPGSD